jgi:hypothetical protein
MPSMVFISHSSKDRPDRGRNSLDVLEWHLRVSQSKT